MTKVTKRFGRSCPLADLDLELRRRGWGGGVLALLAFLSSAILFFFLPNIRGGAGPPDPSPRSATGVH